MLKKIVSGLMVIMLMESVISFITVFPNPIAAASSNGSEDWWRAFRHDSNHTGHSNSTVPITLCPWWDTGETINDSVRSSPAVVDDKVFIGSSNKRIYALNIADGSINWTYYAGYAIESSPAVVDSKVFIGSMNGSVYALNEATGSLHWKFAAKDSIYSSPTVADGVVFFGSLDGYVYALSAADKTEKWRFWTASKVYSSPAVSGGRVFIGAGDGRIYALNVTGRYEWFFDAGQNCSSSPSVANGRVFVGSDDGNVYALNATTGEYIWNFTTGGKVKSSPAIADGRVFVGSMNNSVYALSETDGSLLWKNNTKGFVYSSPAVAGGRVFVGSGDNRIYVLNATNGQHICNFTTGGPLYSSPAIAHQRVFIGSDDKKVYAFGAENTPPQPIVHHYPEQPTILQRVILDGSESYDPDGNIINCTWNFGDGNITKYATWQAGKTVSHTYQIARNYTVTLAVTDYHPSGSRTNSTSFVLKVKETWSMYRHDWNHTGYSTSLAPPTNRTLWKTTIGPNASTDNLMYSSPAVVENMVYIASTNGTVYGIDATSGSIVWNKTIGNSIHSSPAASDDRVFIGTDDGWIYAIRTTDQTINWSKLTSGPVYSSPTVADGIVFVASTNRLYAFDMNSGVQKWLFDTGAYIYSSPAVCNGKVYIGSWTGKVYSLNAMTGGEIKESNVLSDRIQSSPVVSHGKVFIGASNGTLYALDEANLKNILWKTKIGNKIDSSPAIANETVFIGSDTGYMYAYSVTGTFKWKQPQPVGPVAWSSPAIAEGKVFVGSTNKRIYALTAEDGSPVWSLLTGGPVDSSPAILNGTLYISSKDGKLYAFWAPIHDIAITGVDLSAPRVDLGETVDINVTVENQGEYDEVDINLATYYSNATYTNLANSTVINLAKRGKTTVPLPWNTTDVAEGIYAISATVTVAIDNDTTDNDFDDGTLTIGGWHNLNATDAWLGYDATDLEHRTKTVVGQGYNATIWATVENEGDFNETNILVTAYWSNGSQINQPIGAVTIEELLINEARLVSILWKTNDAGILLAKGNYTVHIKVEPVAGETEIEDNINQVDYEIHVGIPGDVNADKRVDLKDIFTIGKAFGSFVCSSTPHWVPNCDLNNDGKVDTRDYFRASQNYGKFW